MLSNASRRQPVALSPAASAVVAALYVDEFASDTAGIAMPHAEVHLVVRFGPSTTSGLDVHALGARERAHRKRIRAGQRAVIARLRLGAITAVLGAPPARIAGRIVALEELWGGAAARELGDRLARAPSGLAAAAVVERAIAERATDSGGSSAGSRLVLAAADKLQSSHVGAVARELGMSERNLRRVFREAVGMSPKVYARLVRFERALHAARATRTPDWADIASRAGYYDQAHLIAEFRELAGATPRALLRELAQGAAS